MDKNMQIDKRKHERLNFPYTIECYDPYNDDEIIRGIAMNISVSGICLYIPQPFNKGQELTIKSVVYSSLQKATVCWSEKYDDDYYKVGCCLHNGVY
ncbi:PilZ domain-containing protein [Candidatus Woesearchaeota archaeon]|nr:PilZ domain-containing protein [Candidatus Woesearchaeota archaeon]